MSSSPIVCDGKFTLTATPLRIAAPGRDPGQIHIAVESVGWQCNSVGLGYAIGTLIGWFLDGCEKMLDTEEKRAAFRVVSMTEIHRGIAGALNTTTIVPPKEKQS